MKKNIIDYDKAWEKASKRNEKILAKVKIGQEIVVAGGYYYDESLHEVEYYKLGVKHPELTEKLTKRELFEFKEDTIIYAGNGMCYYTGSCRCEAHYNDASSWMALL